LSEPSLPRSSRLLAVAGMVVAALVGVNSAGEAISLSRLSSLPDLPPATTPQQELVAKFSTSLAALYNGVKDSRSFLLACLAFASALTFVALGRMLRPAGMRREGMRRLLVGSATSAAVLRVIVGAQFASFSSKLAAAVAPIAAKLPQAQVPELKDVDLASYYADGMFVAIALWTALVAGVFVILSAHFRSPQIRELVAKTDERLE
jgi:hypothetical protein